jgi:D-alanyl-D-alanine carboxypeptidase/D-alanyl-D-alanine-endopeptidase (penicillin-binding protein 4)
MSARGLALGAMLILAAAPSAALAKPKPAKPTRPTRPTNAGGRPRTAGHPARGQARIAIAVGGVLRPAPEPTGRRAEPLTLEEQTARQLAQLLRGPLRAGTTGLFVADAHTGAPLFAVNAEDGLNPASNVKMISTATALELLGPTFRYPTRVLGPTPDDAGVVHGDVYLLGSHDPTLTLHDLDDLGAQLARAGVHRIDGAIVVGADPSRDGVFRAAIPIDVQAGAPGKPVVASAPRGLPGIKLVTTATTSRRPGRPHLKVSSATSEIDGHRLLTITIAGSLGKGGATTVAAADHVGLAVAGLQATLARHAITVAGTRIDELAAFGRAAAAAGALPVELARHDSAPLAAIVAQVNKRSINWLADRVIMTAAALTHQATPSMPLALDAMYRWLGRRGLAKADLLIDTGSGLSYRTRLSPEQLVAVVRGAGGFAEDDHDPALHQAWLDSLSIGGTDGTLGRRFRGHDLRGHLRGKTGTLSNVIALSGVLDVDPTRPLVFSIVSNGHSPGAKNSVRAAHEQVLGVLCRYLAASHPAGTVAAPADAAAAVPPATVPSAAVPPAAGGGELGEDTGEPGLDDELGIDPAPAPAP